LKIKKNHQKNKKSVQTWRSMHQFVGWEIVIVLHSYRRNSEAWFDDF